MSVRSLLARVVLVGVWSCGLGLVACSSTGSDSGETENGGTDGAGAPGSAGAGRAGSSAAGADGRAGHAGTDVASAGAADDAGAGGESENGGSSGNGAMGGNGAVAGASLGGSAGSAGTNVGGGGSSAGNGGTTNTGGTAGSAPLGGMGGSAGGGVVVCQMGADHVCPGETRNFGSGVTVSLEISASGPVPVAVAASGTAPEGYDAVGGTPTVTLGAAGVPLAGFTTVSVSGVNAGSKTPLVLLSWPTNLISLPSTLTGGAITYSATLGGTARIVTLAPPVANCTLNERAGGTFDATSIAALNGVTRLTSGITITGVGPTDLSALACLTQISGTLSIHDTTALTSLNGLQQLQLVEGNLDIYSNSALATADSLLKLRAITGRLYVASNPQLVTMDGLTGLTTLGSSLTVDSNARLLSFKASALSTINAGLAFANNSGSALTSSSFNLSGVSAVVNSSISVHDNKTWDLGGGLSGLTTLDGNLDIYSNGQLLQLDQLKSLRTIGGRIYIVGNPQLVTFDGLTALSTLGNSLTIDSNARLLSTKLPKLTTLNAGLAYSSNSGSATEPSAFDLSGLKTVVNSSISIHDNKTWDLGTGLSRLESVDGNFDIYSSGKLTHVDAVTALKVIGGRLYIVGNPELLTIDGFSGLTTLGNSLTIDSNARLLSTKAPKLTTLNAGLAYSSNSGSATEPSAFDFTGLKTVLNSSISIHDNKTWDLGNGLSKLETVDGNFDVYSSGKLTHLDALTALKTIGGRLYVVGNPELLTIDGLTALTTLGNSLTIDSNARLLSSKAPKLTILNAGLAYSNNSGSATSASAFDLSGLTNVTNASISIHDNKTWELGSGLTKLVTVDGNLDIYSSAGLTHIDALTALRTVGGRIYVVGNPQLSTIDGLAGLTTLGNSLTIDSNAQLSSVKLSALTKLNAGFTYSNNSGSLSAASAFDLSGLTTVVNSSISIHDNKTWQLGSGLSKLATVDGSLDIYSNTQLQSLPFAALKTIGGRLYIVSNPQLSTLGLSMLTSLGSSLSIASNTLLPNCQATAVRGQLTTNGWGESASISGNKADTCN